MEAGTNTPNELIRISDELLRCYGLDIDTDDGTVRCLVLSEFFVAKAMQPDLTIYRISQLDNEQNISQLFAVARHEGSGRTDLLLYCYRPWETTFRKLCSEIID